MTSTTDNRRRALAASEGSAGAGAELWCCHVIGPDDLYAAPDKVTAEVWADQTNGMLARRGFTGDVICKAEAAVWPWSADAHAAALDRAVRNMTTPGVMAALATPPSDAGRGYQDRVGAWMDDVFAAGGADLRTRIDRYLEESFELAQALGYDPSRIAAIRDYVFARPVGEPAQETGGVMVTLASLCHAAQIDMMAEAERELARVHTPEIRAKIMAKQASKNALHTPLPTAEAADAGRGDRETAGAHRGTSVVNAGVVISPSGRKLCTTPTYEAAQEVAAAWNAANG